VDNKISILVVDDEEGIRKVLSISLTDAGYEVFTAASGDEALRTFKDVNPSIVLTDIKMPGMDGIELLQKIKQDHPDTEVIMITGHGDMDLAIKSLKHEAVDFVTKPINDDALGIALKRAQERIITRNQLRDYTQKLEQQLVLEKMSSDFLIQQSTAKIVVLNTDFTIAEANEAYLKAIGKPKEEVIGVYCYQVSHGLEVPCSSSRPEMKCPMVETLRTGTSSHVIHEHPGPDGYPTYCNIVTYPLKDQNGEIFQIIEIWRDITEEFSNRWEKRVKEIKSDLQQLVQEDRMISLGKLAASCAHEINNPIQGLLTFSRLMEDTLTEGKPSESDLAQFKKHLALMSRELERCGSIISGLLSFSRESKQEYTDVDLKEVLETVLTLTRHKMNLAGIELITELSLEGLMVKGDANQLQQCFLNLVFNAVEAMPGGGELRIVSEYDRTNKTAHIQIQDNGCGIPEEELDHIFDPFYTTKSEREGTGLGLSIVYGVIKNHKGDIKVNSTVEKGSTFIVDIPTL
jgi:signal transduction histidine kinase/FixJ family two-component response regulator